MKEGTRLSTVEWEVAKLGWAIRKFPDSFVIAIGGWCHFEKETKFVPFFFWWRDGGVTAKNKKVVFVDISIDHGFMFPTILSQLG